MTASVLPAVTLDRWSQDPAFVAAQERYTERDRWGSQLLEHEALTRAGPFTAEDVLAAAGGRDLFPQNAIGCVLGRLRRQHRLRVVGRTKATHPAARGRWIKLFELSPSPRSDGERPAVCHPAGSLSPSPPDSIPSGGAAGAAPRAGPASLVGISVSLHAREGQ